MKTRRKLLEEKLETSLRLEMFRLGRRNGKPQLSLMYGMWKMNAHGQRLEIRNAPSGFAAWSQRMDKELNSE